MPAAGETAEDFFEGKPMKRRRIDPRRAAASAGGDPGWYRSTPLLKQESHCCGQCGAESATVAGPGEPCLICKLKARQPAGETDPETAGPF